MPASGLVSGSKEKHVHDHFQPKAYTNGLMSGIPTGYNYKHLLSVALERV